MGRYSDTLTDHVMAPHNGGAIENPDVTGHAACSYPYLQNPPCRGTQNNGTDPVYNAARSFHPGGVNACMGDGRVSFFKNSISLSVWAALSSAQGGEVISSDSY